jgi:hypothetical protein
MNIQESKEITKKILIGLEKVKEKLIEFKKQKGTDLIYLQDGKIVRVKP